MLTVIFISLISFRRIIVMTVQTCHCWFRFNLIQLFVQNEHSFHLRRMIVDLDVSELLSIKTLEYCSLCKFVGVTEVLLLWQTPRFDSGCIFSQDPAISYIWSEKNLNNDQRRAIIKVNNYATIHNFDNNSLTASVLSISHLCEQFSNYFYTIGWFSSFHILIISDTYSKRLRTYSRNARNWQNIHYGACSEGVVDERCIYFAYILHKRSCW